MESENPPSEHAASIRPHRSHSTANTIGGSLDILVSVPDTIEIKMVNASALEDYEIWFFIASLVAPAWIGFLVAYIQALDAKSPSDDVLFWTMMVFGVLFALSLLVALYKRKLLRQRGKTIRLRTSGPAD